MNFRFIVLSEPTRKRVQLGFIVVLILLAAYLRMRDVTYGADEVCLLPPEERWLYDAPQPVSLYAWDTTPEIYGEEIAPDPRVRTVLPTEQDLVLMRLFGAIGGVLPPVILLAVVRRWQPNWAVLAALFIAAAPWFVLADRWIIRYDLATLCVAVSVWSGSLLRAEKPAVLVGLRPFHALFTLALLLVAPPLGWLVPALLVWRDVVVRRWAFFGGLSGVLLLPGWRAPEYWLNGAMQPDMGTTAALVWLLVLAALWRWRRVSISGAACILAAAFIAGGYTLYTLHHLPYPSRAGLELAAFLRERIPDNSVVYFDSDTWALLPAVRCPAQHNLDFEAVSPPVLLPYLPGIHLPPPAPNYIVTTNPELVHKMPYVYSVGDYLVGRALDVPSPTGLIFGNLLEVMGYEIVTPQVQPGQLLEIRLDWQFLGSMDEQIYAHALFLHVVPQGYPERQIINIGRAFADMPSLLHPRQYALNQRLVALIPQDTAPGSYDVLLGVYNFYDGKRVNSQSGSGVLAGTVEITAPNE